MGMICLQPGQVSVLWDMVKTALVRANNVPATCIQEYLNNALMNILSGKLQCWICFSLDDAGVKKFHAVGITSMTTDVIYGHVTLHVHTLYGLRAFTDELLLECFEILRKYARSNNCAFIDAETAHKRVVEMLEQCGFTRECVRYNYAL